MTEFTIEGFVAKLAGLAIAVHQAEYAALERAAVLVERGAKAEIGGTGDPRDSIEHSTVGDEAHIGLNSETAERQELGTTHMPPHSFLASALVHESDEVVKVIRDGVLGTLIGRPERESRA